MRLHLPRTVFIFIFLFFTAIFSESLMAQEVIGLRVSGLTSAERDSIALQHSDPEGLHVIYACVPAGIIVFATGQHEGTRANLRAHVAQAMAPVVPESRINPGELSLQAAESACKAAREQ